MTLKGIAAAAVAIADRDGLTGVTMRSVAAALGTSVGDSDEHERPVVAAREARLEEPDEWQPQQPEIDALDFHGVNAKPWIAGAPRASSAARAS